jgi:hypothetical protein
LNVKIQFSMDNMWKYIKKGQGKKYNIKGKIINLREKVEF